MSSERRPRGSSRSCRIDTSNTSRDSAELRLRAVRKFLSYNGVDLESNLRGLGVSAGNAIVMQSSFRDTNGFLGEASDVIDCLLRIIGPGGNLFMVSMPYRGSAHEYLRHDGRFDVRRTPSQMGLLSEVFRRRKDVMRSANPMHPVLARGRRAARIVEGHEDLAHSCRDDSPFHKMLTLDTKALLFDVGLEVLTFAHYLEHAFRASSPATVYSPRPVEAQIIDRAGTARPGRVFPFAPEAMRLRNFGALYDEVLRRGLVNETRVGNTRLGVVKLAGIFRCCEDLVSGGMHIFAQLGQRRV